MNKYIISEVTQHLMKLIQLGANVQVVSGKMVYVKFHIKDDVYVEYIYHINKKNKYFLERIKPYPLTLKEFDSQDDIIDIIKIDYQQFLNASNSKHLNEFVDIGRQIHAVMKEYEDLFLYYDVKQDAIDSIQDELTKLKNKIESEAKQSERLYFEKNPDNLK